jgi:hypothetical protein
MSITNKSRMRFAVLDFTLIYTRHFEIEDAHPETLLALVSPSVTRAYHHAPSAFLFASQVNHRVCNRRIALDRIGASPKQKITWLQIIEFEGILFFTHHRLKSAGFP